MSELARNYDESERIDPRAAFLARYQEFLSRNKRHLAEVTQELPTQSPANHYAHNIRVRGHGAAERTELDENGDVKFLDM